MEEKKSDFLKNKHFGVKIVKNHFSVILKFLQICWSDIDGAIGFFEDMDYLLILSINDFKGPLNAKNNFNFESMIYCVKQSWSLNYFEEYI